MLPHLASTFMSGFFDSHSSLIPAEDSLDERVASMPPPPLGCSWAAARRLRARRWCWLRLFLETLTRLCPTIPSPSTLPPLMSHFPVFLSRALFQKKRIASACPLE